MQVRLTNFQGHDWSVELMSLIDEYILLVYHDILHGIGIEGGTLLDFRHASFHASANYSNREKDDGKGYHSSESAATAFAAAEP